MNPILQPLEGIYSGTRKGYKAGNREIFKISFSYAKEKWRVEYTSLNASQYVELSVLETDKLIFYVSDSRYLAGQQEYFTTCVVFVPSSRTLEITTTYVNDRYSWTFVGTKL